MALLLLVFVWCAGGASLQWRGGPPPSPPIMRCYGRLKEAPNTPVPPAPPLFGQPHVTYTPSNKGQHDVANMVDNACDVAIVELSAPPKNVPVKGVPGHFSSWYEGLMTDVIKGRGAASTAVTVHLMSNKDEISWRTGKCDLWTHVLPTPMTAVSVVVSGEAEWDTNGDKLIFYVDPCGLFNDATTPIEYTDGTTTGIMSKKLKVFTQPVGDFLVSRAGVYPNAFSRPPAALPPVSPHTGVSFPYNPWFYYLDLSVLTYNLYAQSHVFPWDPYYEGRTGTMSGNGKNSRTKFMLRLQNKLETERAKLIPDFNAACIDKNMVVEDRSIACIRGPDIVSHTESASGFGPLRKDPAGILSDGLIDPILTRYISMDPSRVAFIANEGDKGVGKGRTQWRYYSPPLELISFKRAYMAFRGFPSNEVRLQPLRMQSPSVNSLNDIYVFEGISGATSSYGSTGMIGLVVVRHKSKQPNSDYDVDIAWRGSRSGAAGRAGAQSKLKEKGNPDWIADLDMTFQTDPNFGAGKVTKGYARTIRETMRLLLPTLRYIHNREGKAPKMLYVTGHSMGGGLATLFVKAMTSSVKGSFGEAAFLGPKLSTWPWDRIKLIAYSAPIVMDAEAAKAMNTKIVGKNKYAAEPTHPMEKFETRKEKSGRETADFSDVSVQTRALADPTKASLYRIIHPDDPIAWHVPLSGGGIKCGLRKGFAKNTCMVGQDLYTKEKRTKRKPIPGRYHEPYWLFKNMRCHAKAALTAPLYCQTRVIPAADDMDGGPAQYVSQFSSMQRDQSFDFPMFMAMKKLYDDLSTGPITRTKQGNTAAKYPFAPTTHDSTGGPLQKDVSIDDLGKKGAVITTQYPASVISQPPVTPWKAGN